MSKMSDTMNVHIYIKKKKTKTDDCAQDKE